MLRSDVMMGSLSQHHLSTSCLSCLLCSAVPPDVGTFSSSSCPMKRYWEFCAFDAVDMLIGVTFTRDTSTLRSFLSSSSSSCLHSKTGFVSDAALLRPPVCCVVLLMLVLLLTLLLVLMLLPIVLKDTHLDALIQQHLLSHVALSHLLTHCWYGPCGVQYCCCCCIP